MEQIQKASIPYDDEFLMTQLELLNRKRHDETLEWQDIADFRSDYIGQLEHRDTIRKGFKLLNEYMDAGWEIKPPTDSGYEHSDIVKLRKERMKLNDARTEFNRQIRLLARKETFAEMVKDIICTTVEPIKIEAIPMKFESNNDLLCHFTDIHTGIEINNWKNTFNQDVLKQRVEDYISNVLTIRDRHNSENCYLVVGELVSGIIHNNLRLQNNMDLMEQFKYICELISGMLIQLSSHFHNIYVYTTPGNHSRISPKKEDALDGENMDILLPFYLSARMQNVTNVHICDNDVEPEIAMFSIRGNNIFASHGHKDKPQNVVQNLTMLFGIKPDIVLLGYRHTNGMSTVYDTKVIQSGCLSGTDDFAMSIRRANKPEQTISVIDNTGLCCLYDVQFK